MILEVIVDISTNSLDKVFEYLCPNDISVVVGQRVLVPFGNRTVFGYVLKVKDVSEFDTQKLKPIFSVAEDFALIKPDLLNILVDLKNTYNLRMIDILHLIVPSQIRSGKIKPQTTSVCSATDLGKQSVSLISARSKNQIAALKHLIECGDTNQTELNKLFGSPSVNKIIEQGYVEVTKHEKLRTAMNFAVPTQITNHTLTEEQQLAVKSILSNKTSLLFGVTGSGKTEVYLNVIKYVLSLGKTAIMLVPEISLTPKTVKQFREKFGEHVAVLHSGLSDGEKFDEWFKLHSGVSRVVVGARSAVFAPLDNLGAIIIDEEHDSSYQSETNPRYETHIVADLRCKFNNCPLVLGSATPTIESYFKAQKGEYNLVELKNRINKMPMPKISLVDMCAEFRSGNNSVFSGALIDQIANSVNNNEQVILFINRRGFSSFQMCKDCGYIAKCTDCDVSLVYHKEDNFLKCHYCGKMFKPLTKCPSCTSSNIKLGNTGTERVVEELKELFPQTKILRLDNDTVKSKDSYQKILGEFEVSKPAILVGTQMIAKGHDFPAVTLVGILDADLSLYYSDFRATEKTFQLITQVAGRAGRAEKTGKVVLQTFFPKHYVYNFCLNHDYVRFYNKEINLRETSNFPPFAKIIRILVTSGNDDLAKRATHDLFLQFKELRKNNSDKFYFLEAMRSPYSKINKKFRYQVLMRLVDSSLENEIFAISENYNKDLNVFVEVNPQSLS